MSGYRVYLHLTDLPERFLYEIQMLIREFLPFAVFSDDGDIRILASPDRVTVVRGDEAYQTAPDPQLSFAHELVKNRVKAAIYDLLTQMTGIMVPWGILTGVRPTKIAWEALTNGMSEEEVIRHMEQSYRLQPDKATLMTRTASRELDLMQDQQGSDMSLYVGIPFCPTRCAYCSFVSYDFSKVGDLSDAYLDALQQEMETSAPLLADRHLRSFYMGGGTPTVLSASQLDRLLIAVNRHFPFADLKEVTVEAGRPDTITRDKLLCLKDHGVGRISINPQTLNQRTLNRVGRQHTVEQIYGALELAREVGFSCINMDFILGLPGEAPQDVERSMEGVRRLKPENLTIHTLAVKRSSRLHQEGDLPDLTGESRKLEEMIAITSRTAEELGLQPYYMYRQKNMAGNFENVGYSLPGKECLYNIEIMEERQSIIAFGAGAVSKVYYPQENRLERVPNVKNVTEYISRVDEMVERKRRELGTCPSKN